MYYSVLRSHAVFSPADHVVWKNVFGLQAKTTVLTAILRGRLIREYIRYVLFATPAFSRNLSRVAKCTRQVE